MILHFFFLMAHVIDHNNNRKVYDSLLKYVRVHLFEYYTQSSDYN